MFKTMTPAALTRGLPAGRTPSAVLLAACLGMALPAAHGQQSPWTTQNSYQPAGTTGGYSNAQGSTGTSNPLGGMQQNGAAGAQDPMRPGGPIKLDSTMPPSQAAQGPMLPGQPTITPAPYVPGEFELYVQALNGGLAPVRRLGMDLVFSSAETPDASPLVPPDYTVVPGDELNFLAWGSIDAELRLTVDKSGRITIPRVGPVMVAGVRYADLTSVISKQLSKQFRNFDVSVSLGQLRGVRVFVTGFAARPGAYAMTSLSTLSAALLRAGGPTAAGSFRDIQLRRQGRVVSTFDFYDLLIAGNRTGDVTLQPDDVVHVGPVGAQVAVLGSVNQPAIVELKPGENVASVLKMVGGFSAVADTSRLSLERLSDRLDAKVTQLSLPADAGKPLDMGDVVRAFSVVDAKSPINKQNKRVVVEGEVTRPGTYLLPTGSTVQDALAMAGGLSPRAFVFGTRFTRESVRISQQENYDRALRDLETELNRSSSTQRATSAEEASAMNARNSATTRLLNTLRAVQPDGRVVLQMPPDARELPALSLEDGDRVYVPPVPTSVGVFGSVFNTGSYLYTSGRQIGDYISLAGGPTRGADKKSAFVIRANGTVISNQQSAGWLTDGDLNQNPSLPGDTVFVPEELSKATWIQLAKDWTQIFYQFGLGAAGLNALK